MNTIKSYNTNDQVPEGAVFITANFLTETRKDGKYDRLYFFFLVPEEKEVVT